MNKIRLTFIIDLRKIILLKLENIIKQNATKTKILFIHKNKKCSIEEMAKPMMKPERNS